MKNNNQLKTMAQIEEIYSQLNNRRLSNEQIEMFTQYIAEFGKESELKEELIYLLKYYNKVIEIAMNLYETIQTININTNPNTSNGFNGIDMQYKPNEDLIKMKLTNSILKQIEFTRKNPHIFTTKYTNGDYSEFLSNLVNYNYSISALSSISNDIRKYDNSFKSNGYSAMSPKMQPKDHIEPYSFSNSLRQYNKNNLKEQMEH